MSDEGYVLCHLILVRGFKKYIISNDKGGRDIKDKVILISLKQFSNASADVNV